jgi:hypothetical protein
MPDLPPTVMAGWWRLVAITRPSHRTGNRTHAAADQCGREGITTRNGTYASPRPSTDQATSKCAFTRAPAASRQAKGTDNDNDHGKNSGVHRDLGRRFRSSTPRVGV